MAKAVEILRLFRKREKCRRSNVNVTPTPSVTADAVPAPSRGSLFNPRSCANLAKTPLAQGYSPTAHKFFLLTRLGFHHFPEVFHNILWWVEKPNTRVQKLPQKSRFLCKKNLTFSNRLYIISHCQAVDVCIHDPQHHSKSKGGARNVPYLSAQEASSQDGARFP